MDIIYVLIAIFVYFAPAINGYMSRKRNASAILMLNLLLGWTIIGWIIALIWSMTKDDKK